MKYPWYKKTIPDSIYLKIKFNKIMGHSLDLKNPKTFNEKLQWLKLHDRNPNYSLLVDKYEVKKIISDKIGSGYIVPTLGIWDSIDDVEINNLPNEFVLKCTHDSGSYAICKNRLSFDMEKVREKFRDSMSTNFYWLAREYPYKNVRPRVIAEKYMVDDSSVDVSAQELTDYKFYCFNGYVDCVMICYDRASGDTKFYFFDQNWELKRINKRGKEAPLNFSLPKPMCIKEMFDIAAKLSVGIPFVRIDLYQSNNKVYFGEMTFYPQGGWDPNYLPETDNYFGSLIDLSLIKNNSV